MNERQLVALARRGLDASTERLPYRITHRLERARREALGHFPIAGARRAEASLGSELVIGTSPGSRWRRATAWVSLILLVGGLYAISGWSDALKAEETAELDLAVLTDDGIPIAGYADRGFGVFLRNSRQ